LKSGFVSKVTPAIDPVVLIRSAGEMASGIAWCLYMANLRRICMVDLDMPLCVRRTVAFCTALGSGSASVEGVHAIAARSGEDILAAWRDGYLAVMRVSDWQAVQQIRPAVVVDAIIAKRNIATRIADAPLVIGLGPGFVAGSDCHLVVETHRGHHLARILERGSAQPNTGTPGDIAGFTAERVLRAPRDGCFETRHVIGDRVSKGEVVGSVEGVTITAGIDGIVRGLIGSGTVVTAKLKLGDIDPRGSIEHCHTISDKARALGGAVLEAIMRHANRGLAA
jgi:xanthine dehydrogenase accessory factor